MIARIGARWIIVCGGLVLAFVFALAYATPTVAIVYSAVGIIGIGFSFVANAPGIYLITCWYGAKSLRIIGLYMMIGALGLPVAEALVGSDGGWRLYWLAMTATALVLSGLCWLVIKEPAATAVDRVQTGSLPPRSCRYREMIFTPQFLIIAIAMVATQTCLGTVAGITPSHFVKMGLSTGFAAQILGVKGLVGRLSTGLCGWLTERFNPRIC